MKDISDVLHEISNSDTITFSGATIHSCFVCCCYYYCYFFCTAFDSLFQHPWVSIDQGKIRHTLLECAAEGEKMVQYFRRCRFFRTLRSFNFEVDKDPFLDDGDDDDDDGNEEG